MAKRKTSTSGPPAKRRKSSSDEAFEDLAHGQSVRERAEPYRLATARFLVGALTPKWTDGHNREPDKKQVHALCAIFEEQQLQRESEENRLRLLCSQAEVKHMKAYLEQAGQPTPETPSSWPWFGDWVKVNGCPAELIAGQHRVEALKAFFQKKGRLRTSSDPDPLWWLCDIYDRGRCLVPLDRRPLTRPRRHAPPRPAPPAARQPARPHAARPPRPRLDAARRV
jgi:hypothetical protein